MATGHSRDAVLKIDNPAGTLTDISTDVTGVTFAGPKGVVDVTTFGDNYRDYLAGVADATLELEGIYDPAAGKAGSILAVLAHGTATQTVSWEYHPQGTASGKPKLSGEALVTNFTAPSALDEAVTFGASLQNTGTVTVGNN